jgi:hypothetical protein
MRTERGHIFPSFHPYLTITKYRTFFSFLKKAFKRHYQLLKSIVAFGNSL